MDSFIARFLYVIEQCENGEKARFAVRTGVSPSRVSRLCHGTGRPTSDYLMTLYNTYGVSADWLLLGVGEPFTLGAKLQLSAKKKLSVSQLEELEQKIGNLNDQIKEKKGKIADLEAQKLAAIRPIDQTIRELREELEAFESVRIDLYKEALWGSPKPTPRFFELKTVGEDESYEKKIILDDQGNQIDSINGDGFGWGHIGGGPSTTGKTLLSYFLPSDTQGWLSLADILGATLTVAFEVDRDKGGIIYKEQIIQWIIDQIEDPQSHFHQGYP